jgi:ribosomal subunit interface protein
MKIDYVSTNMELTPSMKTLAEDKLKTLERHLNEKAKENSSVRIVLDKAAEVDMFKCKMELNVPSKRTGVYYAEEKAAQLESAIIQTVSEIVRQFKKDMEKKNSSWKKLRNLKRKFMKF